MARHEGRSGCAALSGVRQEKKQSAKGLTCHKCGKLGHIRRNCHKGRSEVSAQSTDVDSVRGGRPGARGRGKGLGRGYRGRGGRGGNQAAAGGDASAVASSAATLGGGGAAAGSSGSSLAGRIVYGRCWKFGGACWSGLFATPRPGRTRVWYIFCWCDGCNGAVCIFGDVVREERRFPLFNAKCWSANVASGERRSSTGLLGGRDPCRSEC